MKKNRIIVIGTSLAGFFMMNPVFASANAEQVEAKLQSAGNVVQSI